jgi:hypothetical protein
VILTLSFFAFRTPSSWQKIFTFSRAKTIQVCHPSSLGFGCEENVLYVSFSFCTQGS